MKQYAAFSARNPNRNVDFHHGPLGYARTDKSQSELTQAFAVVAGVTHLVLADRPPPSGRRLPALALSDDANPNTDQADPHPGIRRAIRRGPRPRAWA